MYLCVCVCVSRGKHPPRLLLCWSPSHSFYPSSLCLPFSPTSISPSQPGAPSNRPLLCWLDFSLVNSQRLSVTSSRSLPTDYTRLFFLLLLFSSSSTPWRRDGVTLTRCWNCKPILSDRLRGSPCWKSFSSTPNILLSRLYCSQRIGTGIGLEDIQAHSPVFAAAN